jgi:hypothetical protein
MKQEIFVIVKPFYKINMCSMNIFVDKNNAEFFEGKAL